MYPTPHYKILGRDLSNKPEVGIPLALEILNDPETHRDDILSCVCYLGYRVLDGTYTDVNFLWPRILDAYEMAKSISTPEDPEWFRSRWISSYTILQIYFKLIIFNEVVPLELLQFLTESEHSFHHPPQLPNVMRGWVMLILYYYTINDVKCAWKLTDECVSVFKKSITLNKMADDVSIYEISEALACLMFIIQIKGTTQDGHFHRDSIVGELIKSELNNKSYGFYYKSLLIIYNQNTEVPEALLKHERYMKKLARQR
jgi:hypothetical protein